MSGRSSRSNLLAVLLSVSVLGGLIILFFNKMVFSNLILARGDTFLYFYPYWNAAADALQNGRVPLWNPAIFMGAPFLANSQAGFFYPLNWPLWWLLETPYSASASIVLHVFIAGLGAFLAARQTLALTWSAALVSGLAFAISGYLTAQVEHINQLQGLAWLPWFLLAFDRSSKQTWRDWLRPTLIIGLLFALQLLAGHTQTTFVTAVALAIWILADWFSRRFLSLDYTSQHGAVAFPSALFVLVAGGLLALILAGIQVLPTLELTRYSSRQGGLPVNEVLSFSLPLQQLARTLLPGYGQSIFSEYAAFLPLAFLALAFVGGWQWRSRSGAFPALSLALSGFLLALGAYNPLFWLLARLPGFNLFRAPARWLALYALGMALLTGLGWHLLWRLASERVGTDQRRRLWRETVLPPLLVCLTVLLLLALWGFAAGLFTGIIPSGAEAPYEIPSWPTVAGWLLEGIAVALLLAVMAVTDSARRRRTAQVGLLVVGLLAAFLASRVLPYNNLTTPEAFFDLRPSTARLLAESDDPPQRLLSLSDIFFDPGDQGEIDSIYADQLPEAARYDYTIAIKQKEINAPNLPIITDLASVDGFDGGVLPLRSYSQLMTLLLPAGEETTDGRLREHLDAVPEARWLDLFNTRFLITDKTGDLWREGVFYDRQHPVALAEGEAVEVSYIPPYEATELRLLVTDQPQMIDLVADGRDSWGLVPEPLGDGLYRLRFPRPAVPEKIRVGACAAGKECILEGLTLVDTRDGTFQSLVPGDYRLIHSGDVKIYENSDVLPRAFLVDNWLVAQDVETSLATMRDAPFDVRRTAVVLGTSEATLLTPQPQPAGFSGAAQIVQYAPEVVTVRTSSDTPALLVLTDAHYPGWQATLDGEATAVLQVDALFRGVLVPAGEHEVLFSFQPSAYRFGLWLTLLGLGAVVAVTVALAYGRKGRSF